MDPTQDDYDGKTGIPEAATLSQDKVKQSLKNMSNFTASAIASPNIALIKYWGNRDNALRLPSTGSISMNLAGLETRTQVSFEPALANDQLTLQEKVISGPALERVSNFLDHVRRMAGFTWRAHVRSSNNFPTGAGIASSAAAFAALSLAASRAAGLALDERSLSRLARLGSGSACRSIPGGFVEWFAGENDESSYAVSIAAPDHWDIVDCIAVTSQAHKPVGSTQGHALAGTSPLQAARVADAPRRLDLCRNAILQRDFEALARVVELDSNMLHAVMMTSNPCLLYWQPASIAIMQAVVSWRSKGLPVCYTLDAGPNVHVIAARANAEEVRLRLLEIMGVEAVRIAGPGGPARPADA